MTPNEAKLLDKMLGDLADSYRNAGCNDLFLPDTTENREIVLAAETMKYGKCEVEVRLFDKRIGTSDTVVLEYLRKRFRQHFGIRKGRTK